jgi:hypothetical protein
VHAWPEGFSSIDYTRQAFDFPRTWQVNLREHYGAGFVVDDEKSLRWQLLSSRETKRRSGLGSSGRPYILAPVRIRKVSLSVTCKNEECQIASAILRAPTCCNTRQTLSIGGNGAMRPSPRQSALTYLFFSPLAIQPATGVTLWRMNLLKIQALRNF